LTADLLTFLLQVSVVDDTTSAYAPSDRRTAMASQGKIAFRTCFFQALLPISYVEQLVEHHSRGEGGFTSLFQSFEHWFLVECLVAIGSHTMM